ncbi:MAG TPA: hypothetical protein VIN07_12860, partial [Flavipsychrobacter sp.]
CKKKTMVTPPGPDGIKGNASAVIVNKIQDSVYITFSGSDIATGTQPHIIEKVLPPGDTLVIVRANLKDAHRYIYDWHTKDYTRSSWMQTDTTGKPPVLSLDYYGEQQDYVITIDGQQRNEMLICLDGDGVSSTWEAVDAFDTLGASIWGNLADREKEHGLVITRFHTIRHSFRDTANKAKTTNLAFSFDMSSSRMWLRVEQKADSYVVTNDLSPYLNKSTQAKDTLYFCRYTKDSSGIIYPQPYYLLVRKSVER